MRNTLLYMAAYELILVVFVIFFVFATPPSTPNSPFWLVFVILVILGLLGLLFLPLRGRMLENAYTERLLQLQARYLEVLNRAADKQIAYGMQLRREAIAPLTRLIDAQTEIQTEQLRASASGRAGDHQDRGRTQRVRQDDRFGRQIAGVMQQICRRGRTQFCPYDENSCGTGMSTARRAPTRMSNVLYTVQRITGFDDIDSDCP